MFLSNLLPNIMGKLINACAVMEGLNSEESNPRQIDALYNSAI